MANANTKLSSAARPTWNAISREGLGQWSLTLDTCGFFTRSIDDLETLCTALRISDDDTVPPHTFTLKGARIGFFATPNWPNAGPGTRNAWTKAQTLLKSHGAEVSDVETPENFDKLLDWHADILTGEGQTSFLGHSLRASASGTPDALSNDIYRHLRNDRKVSHSTLLTAYDSIAALRPVWDKVASQYDIVITPSVADEAPQGLEYTGDMSFCSSWTALHVPVVNLPGFAGENGMPVGLSAVGPRYRDRWVLHAAKAVGEVFAREGSWKASREGKMG